MAMQIQRGLVKYKDRSDIICTYGISEDGSQYYFLDDSKLANGNVIVTTTLLEAVDPVAVASHVGVVDENGNVVIPCENKTIKSISSDILLVEKAQPTGESVLESIRLREDPAAATKLVTTPATIKDNINKMMGANGRFVFNDQFSEATICDINGNNLANNEYYSFIGVNDEKIFFSKNTIESGIIEYPLYPVNNDASEVEVQPTLNVETTSVTRDSIEKAINEQMDNVEENVAQEVAPIAPTEDTTPAEGNSEVTPIAPSEDVVPLNITADVEEPSVPTVEEHSEENVVLPEEVSATVENNGETANVKTENITDISDEQPVEEAKSDTEEEKINLDIDMPTENVVSAEDVASSVEEKKDEEKEVEKEAHVSSEEYTENDDLNSFYNSKEPVYVEDSYDYDFDNDMSYNNLLESYDYGTGSSNTLPSKNIFDDVTVTISNLVELNRNLQSMVDDADVKLAKCDASRRKLAELSKSQAREISSLNARIARLETDKQILESKLAALTPSSNGDLVRVMADAHNILGQTKMRRTNNNI